MKSNTKSTSKSESHAEPAGEHLGLERLVFFSDAVFAIAITLLALGIRLPAGDGALTDAELLRQLIEIGPKYLGFILSFLIIGTFWIGHHRRYRQIIRYDGTLLLLNLLLLMVVAFVPFPTTVISEHGSRSGTILYAGTMAAAGLLSSVIWVYASYKHRLIRPEMPQQQIRRDMLRLLVVPAIFILSIGAAYLDSDLARVLWILVAPAMLLIR